MIRRLYDLAGCDEAVVELGSEAQLAAVSGIDVELFGSGGSAGQ